MEDTRCAMGIATDAAVAYVDCQRKDICGNCYGEADALAVAHCCESTISHFGKRNFFSMGFLEKMLKCGGSSYLYVSRVIKHESWLGHIESITESITVVLIEPSPLHFLFSTPNASSGHKICHRY
jgi:hypothetical protein